MPHSNLYLAKLYNDLITNTPQTITMDIPSEVGQGRVSQTKIKHGVIFSDWQMNYRSDMNVQGPVSKEYIQIIFCLNDGISWGILNGHRSMAIQKMSPVFMPDMMAQNIFVTKGTATSHSKALKFLFPTFHNSLPITLTDRKLRLTKRNS